MEKHLVYKECIMTNQTNENIKRLEGGIRVMNEGSEATQRLS